MEYKTIYSAVSAVEDRINALAAEGWRVALLSISSGGAPGHSEPTCLALMEREKAKAGG